jgi:hypothetical protein
MRQTNQIARIRNTPHRPGPQPLQRPNARATEPRLHGDSGPAAPPGHHHVHYHRHGDRGDMQHSPPEASSKPPPVNAGKPYGGPSNGGDTNGVDY